jgi:glycosyltransferase involved in cell wall biosynthesis
MLSETRPAMPVIPVGEAPAVSVVIATFERPDLVRRAVRSALAQTLREIEVIVIVDGRDAATIDTLVGFREPRVRVVVPAHRLGNGGARNAGVRSARGRWIAFLDDDDEWAPEKLSIQLRTAERSRYHHPIVTCHILARDEQGEFVWPRRRPVPKEPLANYLFCRTTPFTGEGIIQTSTIFTSRELLEAVPFGVSISRYVDVDWLLRASTRSGVGIEFVPELRPLSVWRMERRRRRISTRADSAYALEWAAARRHLLGRRAYAAFVMSQVSRNAALAGEWWKFFPLAAEAYRHGRPSVVDVVTHVANFTLPEAAKHAGARAFARVSRRRRGPDAATSAAWPERSP